MGRGLPWPDLEGALITLPAGVVCWSYEFALTGFGMGVVYEIAHHIPSKIKGLNRGPELGEVLFGAWVFYGMV